ncbi:protein kinase [Strigomonas culicis]|uniref:Protein kinase n=1 Tax=Strigomonas culicis TaxID=28005 RepID=S9UKP6_9TRYP|nr:protein kinase [Strigomonas culicis]|eukprot:EPY15231.1 protein kinase [Strigomonas culicis]
MPSLTPTPAYTDGGGGAPLGRMHSTLRVALPTAPAPVNFGALVAHYVEDTYVIEKKVSEGTYGEVYLGRVRDGPAGARVALKRLKTLRGLDGFPLTSLREVIALQHVEAQRRRQQQAHPPPLEEIIRLRDVLLSREEQHSIFLVFDYASCSLSGLLHRGFLFETYEVSYLFRKIIKGVRQLHAMGVIHRDIKSDNILLTTEGRVQLADFGLCVFKNSDGRALTPSMINLNYRPPEMLLGSTTYDEKVDIWSIGCMLAQLYLGAPPFYRRRSEADKAKLVQHNRAAETELEQLAVPADVLGPLPLHVFADRACKHLPVVQQLQREYLAQFHGVRGGPAPAASDPPPPVALTRAETLFHSSFLFSQFGGLRRWFVAQMENREPSLSGTRPRAPALRPTVPAWTC